MTMMSIIFPEIFKKGCITNLQQTIYKLLRKWFLSQVFTDFLRAVEQKFSFEFADILGSCAKNKFFSEHNA